MLFGKYPAAYCIGVYFKKPDRLVFRLGLKADKALKFCDWSNII